MQQRRRLPPAENLFSFRVTTPRRLRLRPPLCHPSRALAPSSPPLLAFHVLLRFSPERELRKRAGIPRAAYREGEAPARRPGAHWCSASIIIGLPVPVPVSRVPRSQCQCQGRRADALSRRVSAARFRVHERHRTKAAAAGYCCCCTSLIGIPSSS